MPTNNSFAPLSKESEDRILSALEKVADFVATGENPNDAIAKAASEMKIPSGHVELLARAYNIGKTNSHRKQAEDVFEKANSFPLADASKILKIMYPDSEKSAAVKYSESAVSEEYSRAPLWASRVPTKFSEMTKAATAKPVKLVEKVAEAAPPQKDSYLKTLDEINFIKRGLEELRRQKSAAMDKLDSLIVDFKNNIKREGQMLIQEVGENLPIMFGKQATNFLIKEKLMPKAIDKKASRLKPIDPNKEPYSTAREIFNLQNELSVFETKFAEAQKKVSTLEGESLRPFFLTSNHHNSVISGIQSSKEAGLFSSGLGALAKSEVFNEIKPKPKPTLVNNALMDLTDPYKEDELRQARVGAMLTDLMANDEIISSHDPKDVLRIYNELNETSPRAAGQKMLVRAMLRKRLEYGGDKVDPFDVDQLLNVENKLKQRDAAIPIPTFTQTAGGK